MGTYTGTTTYSRFSLLKLQVINLIDTAAHASKESCAKVSIGLDNHYIEQVGVQGIYSDGDIGAELRMKIDWREHIISLKAGGESIQIPSNWSNGIAPSISEAIKTFIEACNIASLSTEWFVCYGPQCNRDEVNRILGFRDAEQRKWKKEPERIQLGFGPLSEASLIVSLAI